VARGLIGLTQTELAEAANLGLSTVVDYELARRRVSDHVVGEIRAALEAAGVEFTNGKRPGVRLRPKG